MLEGLSETQASLVREFTLGEARRYIASGATRSGKTLSGVISIARLAIYSPGCYLLAAPRMPQVYNLLDELQALYGDAFEAVKNQKKARLFDSEFHLYSGNNEGAEAALRGFTYKAALVDEAVVVPESFLQQVIIRCSQNPRKVLLLTNPDAPYHALKTGWIDRAKTDPVFHYTRFVPADNPSLPDGYEADLKRDLSGAMLQRMLYGEWVLAAGSIYGSIGRYSVSKVMDDVPTEARWIGVDYGHRSPTHAVLMTARTVDDRRTLFAEGEWRHAGVSSEDEGEFVDEDMSHEDKARAILAALSPDDMPLDGVYVDPSAPALIAAFRRVRPGIAIAPARNDVLVGIQQCQTAIEAGTLFVNTIACPWLSTELSGYSWDDKAMLRGERKPIKRDDHGADAMRYVVASTLAASHSVGVRDRRALSRA